MENFIFCAVNKVQPGHEFLEKSFIFGNMIFCIEKQLFFKGTSVLVKNNLFFAMWSLVPFTVRSVATAESPRKYIFWEYLINKNC